MLNEFAGKCRKENTMTEGMTNQQFEAVIRLIIKILKDDGVKEETIKKIEVLLNK